MHNAIQCCTVKPALTTTLTPISFRFSKEIREKLKELSAFHRLPQVKILEAAIRQKARRMGLQ